ncbi:MAG: hypothetical protein FJ265_12590 [Planctomycetes bacterium]|nr:hypothetical protein [Planctomycetota bacterium]
MNGSIDRRSFGTTLARGAAGGLLVLGGALLALRNGRSDCPALACRECDRRATCDEKHRAEHAPRREEKP